MRDVRGRRSEDVIFAGSERRKPAAMAEVQVCFDNETGWLSVESSEAELVRRIYRSAEGEYLINGEHVRLRDIGEVVRDAGLTTSGHTIVGQGMVDSVLSLRGIERRQFIATVAGVAPYEARRAEALHRLEQTRGNLASAQIVFDEMEPRLRILKRQVNVGQNALAAKHELTAALEWHYGSQWRRRSHEELEIRECLNEGERALGRIRAQITEAGESFRSRQMQFEVLRSRREDASSRVLRAEYALRRGEDMQNACRETIDQLRREDSQLEERLEHLSGETEASRSLEDVKRTVAALERRRLQLVDELTGAKAALSTAAAELANVLADRGHYLTSEEEARQDLSSQQREIDQLKSDLAALKEKRDHTASRLVDLAAMAQTAQSSVPNLQGQITKIRMDEEAAESRLAECAEGVTSTRRKLVDATDALVTAKRKLDSVNSDRDELLRSHDKSRSTVIDTLRTEPHFSESLAVALGDLMEAPASPHPDEPGPRRDTRPGDAWRQLVHETLKRHAVDVEGWLDELVRSASPETEPIPTILSSTLVISRSNDLERAWSLVATLASEGVDRPGLSLADLEGNLRRAGGRFVASIGSKKRVGEELKLLDLEARQEELGSQIPTLTEIVHTAEGKNLEAQLLLEQAEESWRETSLKAAVARSNLSKLQQEVQRLIGEHADAELLLTGLDEEEQAKSQGLREVEANSNRASSQLAQAETSLKGVAGRWENMQNEMDHLADEDRRLESEVTLVNRQLQLERTELARLGRIVRLEIDERQELTGRLLRNGVSQDEASHGLKESEAATAAATADLAGARKAMQAVEDDSGAARTDEKTGTVPALHRQLEETVATVERLRSDLKQSEEALAALVMDCDLDVGKHPSSIEPPDLDAPLTDIDIRRLRVKAEQAEDIDPGVLQEFESLATSREQMEEQMEDLRQAATHLETVLNETDREARRRFRMTFRRVNELFSMYFGEIFDGGSGELQLETIDEIESVEIAAQLPGKRACELSGLSGGERTLVAGAFLFSLIAAAPPPFCVLDEVDAALDETNVDRYLGVLRGLSEQTQFVVVTHNRGTMAAANSLYGIVLDRDLGSRALSLRLDEAVAG